MRTYKDKKILLEILGTLGGDCDKYRVVKWAFDNLNVNFSTLWYDFCYDHMDDNESSPEEIVSRMTEGDWIALNDLIEEHDYAQKCDQWDIDNLTY